MEGVLQIWLTIRYNAKAHNYKTLVTPATNIATLKKLPHVATHFPFEVSSGKNGVGTSVCLGNNLSGVLVGEAVGSCVSPPGGVPVALTASLSEPPVGEVDPGGAAAVATESVHSQDGKRSQSTSGADPSAYMS